MQQPPVDAPVIVGALRTPIGTAGHALSEVTAAGLAAPVLAALARSVDGLLPSDVVLGNCMGPGGDVARVAALSAGLPVDVPALTVDRQCGSGLAAIDVAAALVRSRPGLVLAGGAESASTAPWRYWPPVDGQDPVRYARAPFAPAELGDPDMGVAADALAAKYGVSRARQDAYAARSHARAAAAWDAGVFDDEVLPVGGLPRDERVRPGMTVERLARLRPAFAEDGTVTAGNASGINDAAAAVVLMEAGAAKARGAKPLARLVAYAHAGVDPKYMGIGPVPATQLALKKAGLTVNDLDVIEANEAFAAQACAVTKDLGLDPAKVNPNGSGISLGHPIGATGALITVKAIHELQRIQGRYALVTMCIGGGQGIAAIFERI